MFAYRRGPETLRKSDAILVARRAMFAPRSSWFTTYDTNHISLNVLPPFLPCYMLASSNDIMTVVHDTQLH